MYNISSEPITNWLNSDALMIDNENKHSLIMIDIRSDGDIHYMIDHFIYVVDNIKPRVFMIFIM